MACAPAFSACGGRRWGPEMGSGRCSLISAAPAKIAPHGARAAEAQVPGDPNRGCAELAQLSGEFEFPRQVHRTCPQFVVSLALARQRLLEPAQPGGLLEFTGLHPFEPRRERKMRLIPGDRPPPTVGPQCPAG